MIADDEPADEGKEGIETDDIRQDDDIRQVDEAGEPLKTGELALDDGDDDRLPWLEADEDDSGEGADGGRILGFAVIGFLALVAIVGAIWWFSHGSPDETLVADGSTIAAPKTPYKEAPKDAGGKTFEGTGDTAFAVSQGRSQAANQAPNQGAASAAASGTARPGIDIPPKAPSAASSAAAPAAAAGTPGTMVQVGAYTRRQDAEAAWTRISERYSALSGQRHVVAEGQADIGTVFRLQVSGGSADGARAMCGRLKSQGLDCQVK